MDSVISCKSSKYTNVQLYRTICEHNLPRKVALTCSQAMLRGSSKSLPNLILTIHYQKEEEPASYYHKDFATLPFILSHRCLSSGSRYPIFSFMAVPYCKTENCFKCLVLLAVAEIQLMSLQPMFMLIMGQEPNVTDHRHNFLYCYKYQLLLYS